MARKSRLTEIQWAEIEHRNLYGESIRSLAKEYCLDESAVRKQISTHVKIYKDIANQIAETQLALGELPISTQIGIQNYAQKLFSIAANLGDAAVSGSEVAKRVSESAKCHVETLADEELLDEGTMNKLMIAGIVASSHGKLGLEVLNMAAKPNQTVTQPKEIKRIERVIVSSKD